MVLGFEISYPIKRICIYCNEIKLISVNAKPICKKCLNLKREKRVYSEKLILFILLILLLFLFILL